MCRKWSTQCVIFTCFWIYNYVLFFFLIPNYKTVLFTLPRIPPITQYPADTARLGLRLLQIRVPLRVLWEYFDSSVTGATVHSRICWVLSYYLQMVLQLVVATVVLQIPHRKSEEFWCVWYVYSTDLGRQIVQHDHEERMNPCLTNLNYSPTMEFNFYKLLQINKMSFCLGILIILGPYIYT